MAIQLGNKVKCKYTSFTGVAVGKTEYINGCVQYTIAPKVETKDKYPDEISIDENSLIVVKPIKKMIEKKSGGPTNIGKKMKGF